MWVLLGLVPLDLILVAAHVSGTILFALSAVALIPLAWLIGEATESAGAYTGPVVGGLLNASFGNAPELIFAVFAVRDGLFEVVRGSLTGSVIGNLLLVLGFSLLLGGRARLDRASAFTSIGGVAAAFALFLLPAAIHWANPNDHSLLTRVSLPVCGFLLLVYVLMLWHSIRREIKLAHVHADRPEKGEEPVWSLKGSIIALAAATAATAVATEILTSTIEQFSARVGMSSFFAAAIIVAIVANAAEHGGAVVIAMNGKVSLASEIALQSSSQVALLVLPAVVFASLLLKPLPLAFTHLEMIGLGTAVILPALLLASGKTSSRKGAYLIAAYGGIAALFFLAS
jgi:Ca2+:H+ antiporter